MGVVKSRTSTSVVYQLPKLRRRVRLPCPAVKKDPVRVFFQIKLKDLLLMDDLDDHCRKESLIR